MTPERTKEEILNDAAEQYRKVRIGRSSTWDTNSNIITDFMAGAKWQESQCSPVESKWVSVDKELPKVYVHVLVHHGKNNPTRGFIDDNGEWQLFYFGGCEPSEDEVTHWMPFPELPSPTIEETKEK